MVFSCATKKLRYALTQQPEAHFANQRHWRFSAQGKAPTRTTNHISTQTTVDIFLRQYMTSREYPKARIAREPSFNLEQ